MTHSCFCIFLVLIITSNVSMFLTSQARRFITLIDELYNHHCCLYCSAAASIDDLFQGTEEGTLFDLERQASCSHNYNLGVADILSNTCHLVFFIYFNNFDLYSGT